MTAGTRRDLDRRMFGGVCAGIAARYQYDLTGVRLATVALAVVTAGIGALAYVVLWLFLPSAAAHSPTAPMAAAVTAHVTLAAPAPRGAVGTAEQLYGQVAGDLPLVDEALLSLAKSELPWLREMLRPMLAGGGKKLRPALALIAGRFGNYDLERLVPLAASVELLHTATLVHDDVIDDAPHRRGRPTAAALFGNAASVMLGDYMFAHAADFVAQTDNIRVIRNFAGTLRVMASGELQQDISAFQYSEDVQRYLDRIAGKTASLFATATEGGAIVTRAPEPQVAALRHYGESLGMAFQVVDDILDFTGDPEEMGKPVGSDLREGTLTLPAIFYMQGRRDDNPVRRAFDAEDAGARDRHLAVAIEEIRNADALDQAREIAERFGARAREALVALPAGQARSTLDGLVDYVLERRS